MKELYRKDLVLKSKAQTQRELFQEIGDFLYEKKIVTAGFTQALIERERNYPTGLDLSLVDDALPNVAIPHTDASYCRTEAIVCVKLEKLLSFKHMIAPDESLDVRYVFFIINHLKNKQSTILSELMAFITKAENLKNLDELKTEKEIYDYLICHTRRDEDD